MTFQQIRESLKMINSKKTNEYCRQLKQIATFISSNKITNAMVTEHISMGIDATIFNTFRLEGLYLQEHEGEVIPSIADMQNEFGLLPSVVFSFYVGNGKYSFAMPTGNEFYNEVCDLLNIPQYKECENKEVAHTFITDPIVIDNIKKAMKFAGKFKPCVMLRFSEDVLKVVGTDGTALYESKAVTFESIIKDMDVFITTDGQQKIKYAKFDKNKPLEIRIFSDDTMSINGIEIEIDVNFNYPKYQFLFEDEKGTMIFDKKDFVSKVKYVLPCANKCTSQVSFHLNGSIDMKTEEVDYGFESKTSMEYISKDFDDLDISFDGKLLLKCLSVFNENTLKMRSDADKTKPVIFTNDCEKVLLMPFIN